MFRFRDTCSVWERFRTDEALYPARVSHRRKPGTGCKGEALDGGHGGVPHNKVPPSPGERLSHKSKVCSDKRNTGTFVIMVDFINNEPLTGHDDEGPAVFRYLTLWSYETSLWRGEGGQGDEVGRLVILTSIGLNLPLTAGWGPEWRFDLGNSRALRRKTHPILNSYQDS